MLYSNSNPNIETDLLIHIGFIISMSPEYYFQYHNDISMSKYGIQSSIESENWTSTIDEFWIETTEFFGKNTIIDYFK